MISTRLSKNFWDIETVKDGIMSFLDKPKVGDAKTIVKEHIDELKHMQLYRQDFNEQEVILEDDLNLSNQWIEQSYLRFETESIICAAQE